MTQTRAGLALAAIAAAGMMTALLCGATAVDDAKPTNPPASPPAKGADPAARPTTPATRAPQDIDPAELERRRAAAREALRQRHEEALRNAERPAVDRTISSTARRPGDASALDTAASAPGVGAENLVIRLEPAILDLGEMVADVSKTGMVRVHNISEAPVTIARLIASCGCTTAPAPREPIPAGEYVDIPITLAPGARQGVNHSKRVTFTIDGHPPVVLTVQGVVAKYIDIMPELLSANVEDPESGRIALVSADGEPFRVLAVNPAIVKSVPAEAALEHVMHIDWELWERAGSGVRVTFSLDHPKMPAVSAMIRRTLRPGERPDPRVTEPTLAPLNANTAKLIAAAKSGDMAALDEAMRAGAEMNEADRATGRTALHWAAREGHTEVIEVLINAGATVDREDRTGKTALSTAAELGRAEAVSALLAHEAKIDHRDRIGGSPLLWAAGLGNVETVKLLIDAGANVDVADTNGLTALLWAAGIGDPKSVALLLDAKADPSIQDRISGDDVLIRAARSGKDDTVKLLLERGVRIDTRNNTGMTALHMAASSGSLDRVKLLVEAKASLAVTDTRGWTPLDHAKNRADAQRDAVVAYLESVKK